MVFVGPGAGDQYRAPERHRDTHHPQGEDPIDTAAVGSLLWPIGSVFIAVVATNPGTLLGFGTWSAFGAGRVLVGLNSADTDFDVVEETGGAKTHVHTDNLNHDNNHSGGAITTNHAGGTQSLSHTNNHSTDGNHSHTATSTSVEQSGANDTVWNNGGASSTNGSHTHTAHGNHTVNDPAAHGFTQPTGHSNHGSHAATDHKMPYIVAYFWKRTA